MSEFNHDKLAELTSGLEYTAAYVPFSMSRNAKEKHRSLNWIIRLKRNGTLLQTDFMQGIGHLPKAAQEFLKKAGYSGLFNGRHTVDSDNLERAMVESGKVCKWSDSLAMAMHGKPLPHPSLADVLSCLLMDAEAIDYVPFEEWANNIGENPDSRKAEATYRHCLDHGLKLRQMFGDALLTKLRELFQDY
jgi:hypothetical protein